MASKTLQFKGKILIPTSSSSICLTTALRSCPSSSSSSFSSFSSHVDSWSSTYSSEEGAI
ncbi:hypothetical protein DPMN_147564 [Dreissena polymorpha]|uniref:Uncharacterized protein n=1 Tax=Dreissena polymorpha TaxID=45954 RepID=A0A9D4F841_DREPO|nr:hypothetical protein DPMN_147564 [Dreissena polymorpha]